MTAELIFVGTELLLGDILNTNAQYLSRRLSALGIPVLHQCVIGDNADRLAEALRLALTRSDLVLTTGGLGPTKDDLTKETAAAVCKKRLVRHKESLDAMRAYFSDKGAEMPKSNEKQADLPEGALVFPNSNGTAPGCAMETDGRFVLLLPGPPREMKAMFERSAVPFLRRFSEGVIVSHSVRTFGIGESAMAERVSELLDYKNPTVAPYAKNGEALLRITAKAETEKKAEALIAPVLQTVQDRLCDVIYGVDVSSLEEAVVALLKEKKLTVATAESATAGLIAKRLTDIPGASEVFHCGIVSYADKIKARLLGVERETLQKQTAVCADVAAQMAIGALRQSGAYIAVSVTGLAGPGKDEHGRDAGLAFLALTDGACVWKREVHTGHTEDDCRDYNRTVFASNALHMIYQYAAAFPNKPAGGKPLSV
ncbi:MAG: competence/damage-inducible protein A [Clostridia bacterium]|nr:competence/damage-inducible protein A [Clostridia bacterium]